MIGHWRNGCWYDWIDDSAVATKGSLLSWLVSTAFAVDDAVLVADFDMIDAACSVVSVAVGIGYLAWTDSSVEV